MFDCRHLIIATLALGLVTPALAQATPVKVALDWTPNTNHIGLYVAQAKGFYEEAGLAVDILPYTDTSAGTLVANQIADFGIIGPLSLFTQHTAGADLIGVYAVVQHETGRLVFNDERSDIQSPRDLDGLTYGGFGTNWENALIGSMIRADGGTGDFENVTLGTSAYEALANGAVDFTLEVYTWEGIKAELDGDAQRAFVYADYGVPDQHTTMLGSSQAYLDAHPDEAKAFLAATQRGYAYATEHPDEATDIIIAASNDMLTDATLVRASLGSLIDGDYLVGADGVIGTMDGAKMAALGDYLLNIGMLVDGDGATLESAPDYSRYFTNAYLPQ
ncbi:ABC transporter substrate-binding protein [Devosia sp. BSSL-BM10]|uniref:Thiamine pyrimidine synthase n=1 Tax=Devosia litorisediminis TaxID=2829817 RepID=A0A942I5W9_9HYPH|nr:ABC transporter substrate-binding protein [Devosia litorisediminis]MBS3848587.1 ABC transporter substrate-binding protein [Devosia litorisediminis]